MVRAKFKVTQRTEHRIAKDDPESRIFSVGLVMHPVFSNVPGYENKAFWDATPSGSLQMSINNPNAFDFFREGKEYYLDFSEAPDTPPVVW